MVTNLRKSSLMDLFDFLEKYAITESLENQNVKSNLKRIHKYTYSILIWKSIIYTKNKKYNKDFENHFDEFASDICTSVFLSAQGLYKPARLLLRAGLENFVRSINHLDNSSARANKISDLFDAVMTSPLIRSNTMRQGEFRKIKSTYRELCNYVHSSSSTHMTMISALKNLQNHQKDITDSFSNEFCQSISAANIIISSILRTELHQSHYTYLDTILESLPPKARHEVMNT